ncbi:hypothetical protein HYG81_07805 [Natrinema zhouii]|uniref:DUF7979 domain-containing protein n=1 Tax=Natrinema zhouii TaxID=1710539 RepID=A0A7D6CTC9_9EURY|nr:hypothetical protein [Natrinema zhouii]QLK27493.1 hypothetical protein HYG81_07805 [Natrinema zhouii]
MSMAATNTAATDLRGHAVTLERVESVPADAPVRHVDQLEGETLTAFYEAVTDDRSVPAAEVDLEAGEIIVFTDYYRVERA